MSAPVFACMQMAMIQLRINAGVPVVIMGETGCGKTKLIEALAGAAKAELKCAQLVANTLSKVTPSGVLNIGFRFVTKHHLTCASLRCHPVSNTGS